MSVSVKKIPVRLVVKCIHRCKIWWINDFAIWLSWRVYDTWQELNKTQNAPAYWIAQSRSYTNEVLPTFFELVRLSQKARPMEVVIVRPTRLPDEPEPAVLDPPGKKIQPMAVAGSNARSDRLKRETNPNYPCLITSTAWQQIVGLASKCY